MILVEKIHAERIARVRTALESCGLTQMIVCDPKSVWYLTGVAVEPYERLLVLYLPVAGEPTLFLNKLFNVPNPPCQTIWHTDTEAPVEQIAGAGASSFFFSCNLLNRRMPASRWASIRNGPPGS